MSREAAVAFDRSSFVSALQAYRNKIAQPDEDYEGPTETIDFTIDNEPFEGLIELVTFGPIGDAEVLVNVSSIESVTNDMPPTYVIVHRTSSRGEWVVEPVYHVATGVGVLVIRVGGYVAYEATRDEP